MRNAEGVTMTKVVKKVSQLSIDSSRYGCRQRRWPVVAVESSQSRSGGRWEGRKEGKEWKKGMEERKGRNEGRNE
jgi:hypothetical protein